MDRETTLPAKFGLTLTLTLTEPTQSMLEIFEEKLMAYTESSKSSAKFNSSVIRAALDAKIAAGIEPASIDGMKPAVVKWASDEIAEVVKEAKAIPLT